MFVQPASSSRPVSPDQQEPTTTTTHATAPRWVMADDPVSQNLGKARTGVVLPGFSDDLLTGFIEDQAHRYLRTKELVPIFYRSEDAAAVQGHVNRTTMSDVNRSRSFKTSTKFPAPHPDNLPGILASPRDTLKLNVPLERAKLIVANSMVELPAAGSPQRADFLSREYPDLNELQVLMHGDPGSEAGLVEAGGVGRRINMNEVGGLLNDVGVNRQHAIRMLACYSGDVAHPGAHSTSTVGNPDDTSMAAGLQRYFEATRPDSGPSMVIGQHGMGYVGAPGVYANANIPRDEPRSLRADQFVEQALLQPRPVNKMRDPQMAEQMSYARQVDALTFYPSSLASIPHPHLRSDASATFDPANLHDAATQTPPEPLPLATPAALTPQPVLPVPLKPPVATAEIGIQTLPPTMAHASTSTELPYDSQSMHTFPAQLSPLPTPQRWQRPPGVPVAQTQEVGVQNVGQFVMDMGTQTLAAQQPPAGPQVFPAYTQLWAPPQTFPVMTQTTETAFDPALRQLQPVPSLVPERHFEAATQVNLDIASPLANPLLNPLLPPGPPIAAQPFIAPVAPQP